ncbi:RING-H2 finger protein ATL11-like [Cornus florida]|uniref:RING-H2 finger protein ATL11-like n=1 Tax=Cornus florida TaxID=4283 RepID=UPI00289C5F4E|nr:RING-H2 finger protein ATL11-like [Cornus florida]
MMETHCRLIVGLSSSIMIIFMFLAFAPYVTAQTGTVPPPSQYPLDPRFRVSPSMALVLVCLIGAFFFMCCFSIYIRQCSDRRMIRSLTLATDGVGDRHVWRRAAARGLEPAVLDTFPTFVYSEVKGLKIGKGALECAVCLNEFEDDEMLRLLPKCSHVFHQDCVGAWLASHVTCPVCRANLVPRPGEIGTVTLLSHDSDGELVELDRSHDIQNSAPVGGDDLITNVKSPDLMNSYRTVTNRPPRSLSKKERNTGKFPRSHSTGHSVVQPGENCDRFTLILPEEVRNRLMNTSLSRAKSCVAFPRARSSKKGFRTRSGNSNQGKNYFYYDRFDRAGRSDRWEFTITPPFFSRAGSARSPKSDEVTVTPKSLFKSVKSPLDRLFGGTTTNSDATNGERSFDRLRLDDQV